MRPSDITDGNRQASMNRGIAARVSKRRFNEAVGYYRRKPSPIKSHGSEVPSLVTSFNEAVGYYRRKLGP